MKTAFAILFILFAPSAALPQTAKKISVAVTHSNDDQIGRSIYFALKEAIRASHSFRFVDHEEGPLTPRIVVHLVSMDKDNPGKGFASSISTTIVYDSLPTPARGAYLTSLLQMCGELKVEFCAKNLLVRIDEAAEDLRKMWPQLWKTL